MLSKFQICYITLVMLLDLGQWDSNLWRYLLSSRSAPNYRGSMINAEEQGDHQDLHKQLQHEQLPALFVDTKYWLRNTEFGERANWRRQLKPCTLLERIEINEQAVISLGNSLDTLGSRLEANIRELTLARDGVLLLEQDSFSDPPDPMYVQYLNQSGDCVESTSSVDNLGQIFHFEPQSDDLSWFNPANWASSLNEEHIVDWVPESHQIPCTEDIVVFGSRHASLSLENIGDERAQTISFKVNFRASETMQQELGNLSIAQIRVAGLKIGDRAYTQTEFEQLISVDSYRNTLFQVDSTGSASKSNPTQDEYTGDSDRSPITIDETSIQVNSDYNLCQDEAGCLCANEHPDVMRFICSFNEPLSLEEMPCLDPVQASGYCNRICATVLTIKMDPFKFSERFLVNTLNKLLDRDETTKLLAESVFTGSRRVDHDRYEITFRIVPNDEQSYESLVGRDIDLSNLVRTELEKAATKSFYGIKTIGVKSSIRWKEGNRNQIFLLSIIILLPVALFICFHNEDMGNIRVDGFFGDYLQRATSRFNIDDYDIMKTSGQRSSFLEETDSVIDVEGTSESVSEIALVELDPREVHENLDCVTDEKPNI